MNVYHITDRKNYAYLQYITNELHMFTLDTRYTISKIQGLYSNNTEYYLREIINNHYKLTPESYLEFYFTDINAKTSADFEFYKYENRTKIDKIYEMPNYTGILFLDNYSKDNRFFITNVSTEQYNYKQFTTQKAGFICSPKKGCLLQVSSDKCYGKINITHQTSHMSSYILVCNVYDKAPGFMYRKQIRTIEKESVIHKEDLQIDLEQQETVENDEFFTESFFDNLLYKKTISTDFLTFISGITLPTQFSRIIHPIQTDEYSRELDIIKNDTPLLYNRFLQKIVYKNLYQPNMCDFIMYNYKAKNCEICLIDKLPSIFQYIIYSFKDITQFFTKSYSLKQDINVISAIICPSFIANEKQRTSEFFSIINLSEEMMNIIFEDGMKYTLMKGDMILFNNRVKYNINNSIHVMLLNMEIMPFQ